MVMPELQQIEQQGKAVREQIDDYKDTVFAILGFCSLWFYDETTRQNRTYVKVFQGRRLSPYGSGEHPSSVGSESDNEKDITPDLGIVVRDERGIVGEVKKNFPRDDVQRSDKIFEQLKTYDQNLQGWPTADESLPSHHIVLLVHQTTAKSAEDYYISEADKGTLVFSRPFSIVRFNRSDQRQPYFFFQLAHGQGCPIEGSGDLGHGVQVPMQALVHLYSECKLYDAQPPLPYLLHLIWEHVITPLAYQDPKFERLRWNQKLDVNVSVDDMLKTLYEGFSFRHWHLKYLDRQPEIPRRRWILEACQFLVSCDLAKWVIQDKELAVSYKKHKDVLGEFVQIKAKLDAKTLMNPSLPGFDGGTKPHQDPK
jgi:hypothetical protein